MSPIAILSDLRPRRLYQHVFLLATSVICVTALVVTTILARQSAEVTRETLTGQADMLARAAAAIAEDHLPGGDLQSLSAELGALLNLPDVGSITVIDAEGRRLAGIERGTDGSPRVSQGPAMLPPGVPGREAVRAVGEPPSGHLLAWAPIGHPTPVGHTRIELSLAAEHAAVARTWHDALTGGLIVLLASTCALYVFLRRALQPLADAAAFAQRLSEDPGARLSAPGTVREIVDLVQALNDASARLAFDRLALDMQAARMEGILDTAPDTILGLDEAGRIVVANSAACRMFGHAQADLRGASLARLVPGFDVERIRLEIDAGVLLGESERRTARLESAGLRPGGTTFPAELVLGDVECGADLRYACVISDITERLAHEESLRLATRALDCSGNGVVIAEMREHKPIATYANRAFEAITGYTTDEIVGRDLGLLHQSGGAPSPEKIVARRRLRRAIDEGTSVSVDIMNYRKDGNPFWNGLTIAPVTSPAGAITHYVGVLTDITERIVTEQALAERGSRLDAIFSLSPDGFALFDGRDRLAYVNQAFLEMSGIPQDLLDRAPALADFEAALSERCDPSQPYVPLDAEAERGATVLRLAHPARILERHVRRTGDAGTTILYFRDVTRESEVDRMKSEFLSTAAHELRTPMASIFGFAELLLHRTYDEPTRRKLHATIHRQAGLLVNLLNELLDLARIEARAGKDFNIRVQPLAPIVEETIAAMLVPNDARKVSLAALPPDVLVRVDAEKLRQALTNLLSNAYKYSPDGGEIRLETLPGEHAGRPAIGIRVSDQGIGMTAAQSARAFERFFRADASGNIPGTGLGLCLVKEIVGIQGGRVDLASESGRGTAVTIWLPLPESELAHAA